MELGQERERPGFQERKSNLGCETQIATTGGGEEWVREGGQWWKDTKKIRKLSNKLTVDKFKTSGKTSFSKKFYKDEN